MTFILYNFSITYKAFMTFFGKCRNVKARKIQNKPISIRKI